MNDKKLISKDTLLIQFEVFKNARSKLASDFINENPDIFKPIFLFEDSIELQRLAIDRYIMSWLDSHWTIFKHICTNYEISDEQYESTKEEFFSSFKDLINSFLNYGTEVHYSELFLKLVKHKINFLSSLLEIADKSEQHLNEIEYMQIRDKKLFDRLFQQLGSKNNGVLE